MQVEQNLYGVHRHREIGHEAGEHRIGLARDPNRTGNGHGTHERIGDLRHYVKAPEGLWVVEAEVCKRVGGICGDAHDAVARLDGELLVGVGAAAADPLAVEAYPEAAVEIGLCQGIREDEAAVCHGEAPQRVEVMPKTRAEEPRLNMRTSYVPDGYGTVWLIAEGAHLRGEPLQLEAVSGDYELIAEHVGTCRNVLPAGDGAGKHETQYDDGLSHLPLPSLRQR